MLQDKSPLITSNNNSPQRGPNCWQCRHFAVSHNPSTPYACRTMGFQSRVLPALEVLRADGHFCRVFEAKPSTLNS
jgi:hypothetical protein